MCLCLSVCLSVYPSIHPKSRIMLNGEKLEIFSLQSEIRQEFLYYHYYLTFYERYKMMHLNKKKYQRYLKKKKNKVYWFTLSSSFILVSLLFLISKFYFQRFCSYCSHCLALMLLTAYMTGLLTSFRDPFKCHFISKVFSNHTNNEQLSTYPALFFHRIYDHLIYCTYIWMHSNIWMHSSIKMRSYIAGIEKNVWHLINIF